MATADSTVPNGVYTQQGYEANYAGANNNSSAYAASQQTQQTQQQSQQSEIPKDEVGWYFVEQYYTTLSKTPEKLYLFYNKRSHFVSGTEEQKVQVCVGQKSISDRMKELDFQDAKVRVTNVDSQGSDSNIVIQVIGEISNKGQPHKRFVQTFVLAEQTNGYFVLNDIFRYLAEDDEEEEAEVQDAPVESGIIEPTPSVAAPEAVSEEVKEEVAPSEEVLEKVDEKLEAAQEEPAVEATPAAATNGTPAEETAEAETKEEAPAAAEPEAAPQEAEAPVEEEKKVEEEKPKEAAPTPAPAQKPAAAAPAAPAKPAAPRTWASLAASAHKVVTPAIPAPAQQASSQKASTTPAAKSEAAPAAKEAAPAAEASPAASQGEAGWQSVSGHKKEQSRVQNQAPPAGASEGKRAFINSVYSQVQEQDLKNAMSKFGEVIYLDISRQKNCAFVDFKTAAQFEAAVAANPHSVNGVDLTVEERRQRPNKPFGQFPRGGAPRGRGGMNQGPRGGFNARGGRGGAPARGGRPAAQEA